MRGFQSLGLFSSDTLATGARPLATEDGDAVSAFCDLLSERLAYKPGERDMVLMHHKIITETSDMREMLYESSLMVYGKGDEAYYATQLLLNGKLKDTRGHF